QCSSSESSAGWNRSVQVRKMGWRQRNHPRAKRRLLGEEALSRQDCLSIITDYTAALTALKAGDADAMPRLLPIQYTEQTGGSAFEQQFAKVKYSIPTEAAIMWNNERPFFRDKRVRQAMTMLVDRQKIIE